MWTQIHEPPTEDLPSGEIGNIEDNSADSFFNKIEYYEIDDSEPDVDALIRLGSGALVMIRNHGRYFQPGTFTIYWVGDIDDKKGLLDEFLIETGVEPSKVVWTPFE